eukprot:COSAG01_NODE_6054_length_3878_cov_4.373379_3_plen_37_part_00
MGALLSWQKGQASSLSSGIGGPAGTVAAAGGAGTTK